LVENVQPRANITPKKRPLGDITNAQTPPKQSQQEPAEPASQDAPKLFHPWDHPYSNCYKVSKKRVSLNSCNTEHTTQTLYCEEQYTKGLSFFIFQKKKDTSKQTAFVKGLVTISSVFSMGSILAKDPPPSVGSSTAYVPNSEVRVFFYFCFQGLV